MVGFVRSKKYWIPVKVPLIGYATNVGVRLLQKKLFREMPKYLITNL
jgi:hypothetical protein